MVRITAMLDSCLAHPEATATALAALRNALPADVSDMIDGVLAAKMSYRDAAIIQTAFGLEDATAAADHTVRPTGARSVGTDIGMLFSSRHIGAVRDAYQNVGKNTDKLDRGNVPIFDDMLRWLNTADPTARGAAFEYMVAKVSLTARAVLPMPTLDRARLTFHNCALFMDALLKIPSGGAFEQFAVAACMEALLDEFGVSGVGGLRVETKNLNASDASTKTYGDIQIKRGGSRVEEAFEVTANDWRTKVATAAALAKSADLQRVHILADVEDDFPNAAPELLSVDVDLTVIDVMAYLRTLLAIMRKPAREAALVRLHQLLDRNQPDIERTNTFVKLLRSHKLTAS